MHNIIDNENSTLSYSNMKKKTFILALHNKDVSFVIAQGSR